MKKTMIICLAAAAALSASGIDGASGGKTSAQIRAAYAGNDYDAGGSDYAAAVGGIVKYESRTWKGLQAAAAGYVSHKAGFATGEGSQTNGDFFDENKKSYAYVGEAYVNYDAEGLSLRVGRQLLDTPFADTDDIRMHPNTFEAAVATYSGVEGTTFVGGYIARWAGFDSGDDKSTFKKLAGEGSHGAALLGIASETIENLALQGWYYGVDRLADLYYADAVYTLPFGEETGVELSAQYARQNERSDSGADGSVYGIGASLNVGTTALSAAYNRADNKEGKAAVNGFGGGPYLTSMEEWTIDGMEDAEAYRFSAGVDMGGAGIDGLSFTAQYALFKSAPLDVKLKEWDFILAYRLGDATDIEASYARIDDCNRNGDGGNDAGYSRLLGRINYNF